MTPADFTNWLRAHREKGRELQEAARKITTAKAGMAWRDPGPEGEWRDELVNKVADEGYVDWSYDLLYMGENFHRAQSELNRLVIAADKCPQFSESVQFHSARLMVLDDFRRWLRDRAPAKPKTRAGRKRIDDNRLLDELKRRVDDGATAFSAAYNVALESLPRDAHQTTVESLRRRLYRKFSE